MLVHRTAVSCRPRASKTAAASWVASEKVTARPTSTAGR